MTVLPHNPQSRLEPELIPRRDVLGLAALWTMATAWLFAAFGMLRLPKAAVVASPSKKFRLLLPDTIAPGEAFVPPGRTVAVFRDSQGVHAVSLVCTHLGCIVKPTAEGFAFRVDLRLRPEGSRGPICNSLGGAERYYEAWGGPYDRLWRVHDEEEAAERDRRLSSGSDLT